MVFLPAELFTEVGYHLVEDEDDRPRAQAALCALSRTSKAFRLVFTPFLYREIVIRRDKEQTKSSKAGRGPLTKPLFANLFANLAVLELVHVHFLACDHFLARLLAPGQKKRINLKELTIYSDAHDRIVADLEVHFLLELVSFVRPEWYSPQLNPAASSYFVQRHPSLTVDPEDKDVLDAVLSEAHCDFASFKELFSGQAGDDIVWNGGANAEVRLGLAKPVELSPWSSLGRLTLQIESSEALCLIFHGLSFPVLRHLKLYGQSSMGPHANIGTFLTFRIAANSLDLPAVFFRPTLLHDNKTLATEYGDVDWTAPTEKELANYPYKPYRGPKLAVLDLSCFFVIMPW
ncbi:hypothetical protein JCM6882_003542 [Rhodosporidiobolus microsporus]